MNRPVPAAHGGGYAGRPTATTTRLLTADANGVFRTGPNRKRIQIVIGCFSSANFVWGIGSYSALSSGAYTGIFQQAQSGMIMLNAAFMGDSIGDDIWVAVSATTPVVIETLLVE